MTGCQLSLAQPRPAMLAQDEEVQRLQGMLSIAEEGVRTARVREDEARTQVGGGGWPNCSPGMLELRLE